MTLRDNASRGHQAMGMFQALLLILLLEMGLAVWQLSDPRAAIGLAEGEAGLAQGLKMLYYLIQLLEIVMVLVSLIVLIRWLRRAYWNLHQLGRPLEHSEGWAAGAWFVPFLNLVRPYSIVKEVWLETQQVAFEQTTSHALLRWWWVIFLLGNVAGQISSRMTPDEGATLLQIQNGAWANILDCVLGVAMALLTIRVVKRIAAFEEQMDLRLQVSRLGGPAPAHPSELQGYQSDYADAD